jgi:hypothetical protein
MARDSSALVSAALRHVRDAEYLLEAHGGYSSPDQAYHLAGFGPECVRKAALSVDWFDRAIGHRYDAEAEKVLEVAIALDSGAVRYRLESWASRFRYLGRWAEIARYERTGARDGESVRAVVREARVIVDEIVLALWLDARLGGAWS